MYAVRAMATHVKLIKNLFHRDSYCISETVAFLENSCTERRVSESEDAMMGAGRRRLNPLLTMLPYSLRRRTYCACAASVVTAPDAAGLDFRLTLSLRSCALDQIR